MTRIERLIVRFCTWCSPTLQRLFHVAGGAREALATFAEANAVLDLRREQAAALQRECREAAMMYTGHGVVAAAVDSREAYDPLPVNLKERFWELELALEDRGWQRQIALSQMEFSRYGIQQIMLFARLYAIKNPLTKREITVSAHYVFGRGLDISCDDKTTNESLQHFLEVNKKELSHTGLVDKDKTLRTDGNLYFVFFTNQSEGETTVRTIDAVEVAEILTDPNDSSVPNYYLRTWVERVYTDEGQVVTMPRNAWYPAINFDPPTKPQRMRSFPVLWDTPVYHVKTGGMPKWTFGCPEVYAGIDWARAYKEYLEAWASITQTLRRFAWNVETQGGTQAMQNFSRVLSSTLGDGGTSIETNPPDVMGSTFVTGPGNKLTPVKTAGIVTSPEEGRRLLLMFCAHCGLPETFFGDTSTGSLATAQSLDRPTELQFLQRQELWREILQTVCVYGMQRDLRAPNSRLRSALREAGINPERVIIEGARARIVDRKSGGYMRVFEAPRKVPGKTVITVKVDFPAVLEHDISARVNAIVEAMGLNGFTCTGIDERVGVGMLLAELGYEAWPELLEKMYPESEYDPERSSQPDEELVPVGSDLPAGAPMAPEPPEKADAPGMRKPHPRRMGKTTEAQVARALIELRRVLKEVKESRNGHGVMK